MTPTDPWWLGDLLALGGIVAWVICIAAVAAIAALAAALLRRRRG
jgi:hypothetical protein